MGIVHKLLPKIRDFIISQKQANPKITCRKLSRVIQSKFKAYISKSSVSAVLKEANLSSGVGRPGKTAIFKPEKPQILDNLGTIFLAAADLETGLINAITKFICTKLPGIDSRSLKKRNEILTFLPAFGMPHLQDLQQYSGGGLWSLIGYKYKYPYLWREIEKMPNIQPIADDIVKEIEHCLKSVDYLKITLSHGDAFYLDPQFRTIWQNQNMPMELSLNISKTMSYIDRLFIRNADPIVLQFGPDFKSMPNYFLDFIFSLEARPQKRIIKISLYSDSQEIERFTLGPESTQRRNFIIGFLPEQISRSISSRAWDFKKIMLDEPAKQDLYADSSEIDITQDNNIQSVILNICPIKQNLYQEPDLYLLTNYSAREKPLQDLIRLYFQRWPGYPAKFEYAKPSARTVKKQAFSYSNILYNNKLDIVPGRADLSWLYSISLEMLNQYAKALFFTQGYAGFDFHSMRERFYQIPGKISQKSGYLTVELAPKPDFIWQRDFIWKEDFKLACKRLNQANVFTPKKERIRLQNPF